jgi:hypothetical protein
MSSLPGKNIDTILKLHVEIFIFFLFTGRELLRYQQDAMLERKRVQGSNHSPTLIFLFYF